jgi:hypothetical protein
VYCIKCGAENPDEARFCHKCGTAIIMTHKKSTWPVSNKNYLSSFQVPAENKAEKKSTSIANFSPYSADAKFGNNPHKAEHEAEIENNTCKNEKPVKDEKVENKLLNVKKPAQAVKPNDRPNKDGHFLFRAKHEKTPREITESVKAVNQDNKPQNDNGSAKAVKPEGLARKKDEEPLPKREDNLQMKNNISSGLSRRLTEKPDVTIEKSENKNTAENMAAKDDLSISDKITVPEEQKNPAVNTVKKQKRIVVFKSVARFLKRLSVKALNVFSRKSKNKVVQKSDMKIDLGALESALDAESDPYDLTDGIFQDGSHDDNPASWGEQSENIEKVHTAITSKKQIFLMSLAVIVGVAIIICVILFMY